MVKNRKPMEDSLHGIHIIMDENGNVYYTKINNSYKLSNPIGSHITKEMKGFYFVDSTGKLTDTFDGYKLDIINVIAIYHVETGNGGLNKYILLKSDGTIGCLEYFYMTRDIVIMHDFKEQVPGYNNIVGVIQLSNMEASDYKLIDINGNLY